MIRYLAPTGSGTDYTLNSARAIDPLPALDTAALNELAWRARRLDRLAEIERFMARHRQSREIRVRRARAQARFAGINVRPELFTLRRTIEAGRSDLAIERRIQALERKAFPEPKT